MRCLVPSCDHDSKLNSKSRSITIHLLPTDPSKRVAWLKALGEVSLRNPDRSAGVCLCHFRPEDIYVSRGCRRLRTGVVPINQQKVPEVFDCLIKPCEVKVSKAQDVSPSLTQCRDVKTCRVCLATDCKLYHTSLYGSLERAYETLTGLSIRSEEHLPPYLCGECARRLLNCVHFRNRCLRTRMVLDEIAKNHTRITLKAIKSINRNSLKSNLGVTYIEPNYYDMDIVYLEQGDTHADAQVDNQDLNEIKIENDMFEYDLTEQAAIDMLDEVKTEMIEENIEECLGSGERIDDNLYDDPICDDRLLPPEDLETKPSTEQLNNINIGINLNTANNKRGRKRKTPAQQSLEANESNREVKGEITKRRKRVKRQKKDDGPKVTEDGDKENCEEETDGGGDKLQLPERKKKKSLGEQVDLSVFTVTELTLEQQIQEVEARQHLPQYLNAPYKCAVCYRGFSAQHAYECHLVRHNEVSGSHVCVVCHHRTHSARGLRTHVKASHTCQYNCQICPFVSRHKGATLLHQKFHAGIKYQCPHCSSVFDYCSTYQNHLRIKHASQVVCELCGFMFINANGLNSHKKIKHKLVDGQAMEGPHCETCDVKFLSKLAYDRHLKLSSKHCSDDDPQRISNNPQTMWRPVEGQGQGFRTKPSAPRTAIRRRPAGESIYRGPVDCEQCGETLKNMRSYAQHFRYEHPGENRTQFSRHESCCMCEMCGHVAHCNALLMEHMWLQHKVGDWRPRSPQPERPRKTERPSYQCATCGKRFSIKHNFQQHMFIHTGLRPFKCDYCGKTFKVRAQRRVHMQHVHQKKPWPKRIRSRRKQAASTSVFCDEEQELRESSEGVLHTRRRQSLRKKGKTNRMASVFGKKVCKGENETDSVVSDWDQGLEEVLEGYSVTGDGEQVFDEIVDADSFTSDGEQVFEDIVDGNSMISDGGQGFLEVNEGASVLSDTEFPSRVVINEGSLFSDEEQDSRENDETCVIEYVLDDSRESWYESSEEMN